MLSCVFCDEHRPSFVQPRLQRHQPSLFWNADAATVANHPSQPNPDVSLSVENRIPQHVSLAQRRYHGRLGLPSRRRIAGSTQSGEDLLTATVRSSSNAMAFTLGTSTIELLDDTATP